MRKTILVVGAPRPAYKGKGKARERSPETNDLATNLKKYGDGPTAEEDEVMLATEASRNQAESERVRRQGRKRKMGEPHDSDEAGTSKVGTPADIPCDQ